MNINFGQDVSYVIPGDVETASIISEAQSEAYAPADPSESTVVTPLSVKPEIKEPPSLLRPLLWVVGAALAYDYMV